MFKPITDSMQLAVPGAPLDESYVLDFKAKATTDSFEIAKDVAALANAFGGTVLVGAVESKGQLARYLPLPEADAIASVKVYEQAVRDRCQPGPEFSIERIPSGSGFVLALNVWPSPGQPIGVRLKNTEIAAGTSAKQLHDVFFYPRRVGSNTQATLPEQMPMLVDARMRRFAAQLMRGKGNAVRLTRRQRLHEDSIVQPGTIDDVNPEDACFAVRLAGVDKPISVPLDEIDAVWFDGAVWHVVIRGRFIEHRTRSAGTGLQYVPDGASG